MTKYNAGTSAAKGERTINEASYSIGRALWELQGRNTSHQSNDQKIIERTSSRKHYRVPLGLALRLELDTVAPPGLPETEPPTALVKVHDMVTGLEAYAKTAQGAHLIVSSLKEQGIL